MNGPEIVPIGALGRGFIGPPYLPEGHEEHYLRDLQSPHKPDHWRRLRADEVAALAASGNEADSWDDVRVADPFRPGQVRDCRFHGLVRIGRMAEACLEHHDLRVPIGLAGSRIVACDLGDDVAIHNVQYLAHYIIGNRVILLDLGEMHGTNHAKFGNGIVKDGEDEAVRTWLDLVNEAGGRSVMPFDGMTAGDAWLWARHRDDPDLLARLGEITGRAFDPRRGFYGTVGNACVIKHCRIIKDCKIGPACYIKGANKLKNLSINSSADEPSEIGEGVELVNGIVGCGCHVFYGCKAVRFIVGDHSNLKYGARLIHSYLGDNSTVSCCEILNSLVFPAHEQHHNNSFLIASLVGGQSNIAAGATIGSNHNSRAPDGEVHAGRGFWPGLCVSVKHNSRFAAFTLLAKGDYPAELDVRLPFSLVSNDVARDRLLVMPAYWWLHNMYALARNAWKFRARDTRRHKVQKIEFDALAPDTAEEIFRGMALLEEWAGKAALREKGRAAKAKGQDDARRLGRTVLAGPAAEVDALEVLGEGVENSNRKVVILKARAGYHAYRRMLLYYAVTNLLAHLQEHPKAGLAAMAKALAGPRAAEWVNAGGQLITAADLEALKADVKAGRLGSWDAIHARYDELWKKYPMDKRRHAFATLLDLQGAKALTPDLWKDALDGALAAQRYVADAVYASRLKDFDSRFRRMVYASEAEMEAVLGSPERDVFIAQVRKETKVFEQRVRAAKRGL